MMASWQQLLKLKLQQMSDMRSESVWVPKEKELHFQGKSLFASEIYL